MSEPLPISRLDSAHAEQVRPALYSCCASADWVENLLAQGPFAAPTEVLAASDQAMASIPVAALDEALAGHPRIGDRPTGDGEDARFSRSEQSQVADADAEVRENIRVGNVSYEQRFDRVFLIRAAGRSPQEILAELTRRLELDDASEQAEVREQLRQITRLRLEQLLNTDEEDA